MNKTHLQLFLALAASVAVAFAHASGIHEGGHGHGHGAESEAIGKPGSAANVTRTIAVDMVDTMRFSPASIAVKQGETIRFVVSNRGKIKHEMVLGTDHELKEHYEAMKKFPEMEHADPNQVTVAPGGKGEIIWQFTKAGKVNFACLQPGHYDAGMKGAVLVSGAKGKTASAMSATSSTNAASMTHASANIGMGAAPTMKVPADVPALTDGEVRRIDKDLGKITIKHGPIANLGMPAMTMVFQSKDPAWLDQLKAGDKIAFAAEKINGALTVTKLEPAK